MKTRFSACDVSSMTSNCQKLVGMRLQNVYDINPKTYLLKFSKGEAKELLLVESGTRFHTTQFHRDKSAMPSGFCMKLRKHLRTKRLHSIVQLGMDRALDLTFGSGDTAYHIIVEFYASGNIILTDSTYKIMTLLRVVDLSQTEAVASLDDLSGRMAVGETYPMAIAKEFSPISLAKLTSLLNEPLVESKKKKSKDADLKRLLREKLGPAYGPALVDHSLLKSGLDPNTPLELISDMIGPLLKSFQETDELILSLAKTPAKGYLIYNEIVTTKPGEPDSIFEAYEEFHPYLFAQFDTPEIHVKTFDSFDLAVDDFYSKIESQKLVIKAQQAQLLAAKKLDSVKQGHATQIRNFELAQQNNQVFARAIENNLDAVEAVVQTMRGFIAGGLDWGDLWSLILEEQRRSNPLALLIVGMKLESGLVTVGLKNPDLEDEEESDVEETSFDFESEDEEVVLAQVKKTKQNPRKKLVDDVVQDKILKIDIDISSSAFANARRYYDAKKVAVVKAEKTIEASEKAVKVAERKIQQDLEHTQNASANPITRIRKPFWFEKYKWFITTENFLCVAGRDAQQNEILVRRYMRKGDVYVHADLHGAASVIVKNLNAPGDSPPLDPENPVPPTSLLQAGTMSVCQSRAWEAKIVTSAYWVHFDQVSKSAPTGEYLTTGSFMVRGKKNWLPPVQLVYGIGLLFRVDESTMGRHYYERRPWARDQPISSDQVEPLVIEDSLDVDEEQEDESSGPSDVEDNSQENDQESSTVQVVPSVETVTVEQVQNEEDAVEQDQEDDVDQEDNDNNEDEESNPEKSGSGYITAKARRDMKKGKEPSSNINSQSQSSLASKKSNGSTPLIAKTEKSEVRGKRGKAKKIKDKYADQDEEEREMMLNLLGSGKGPQPKGKKEKAALIKKQAQDKKKEEQARYNDQNPKPSKVQKEQIDPEIKRILEEENVALPDEDQVANMSYLDSVTSQPHPDDILLHAIPVCAPWIALQKYTYKIKLLPGSVKRGKSSKSVLASFIQQVASPADSLAEIRKDLVKAIPEHEVVAQIMAKVKMVSPDSKDVKKKRK